MPCAGWRPEPLMRSRPLSPPVTPRLRRTVWDRYSPLPMIAATTATGLRVPRIETARKIADALGVGLDALCYSERADELADAVLLVCGHVADLSPAQREALMRSIAEYYALLDREHPRGGRSS